MGSFKFRVFERTNLGDAGVTSRTRVGSDGTMEFWQVL